MFENPADWLIAGGLGIGALFGLIIRQTGLCLVGAVSNVTLVRDYRYLLGFVAAALLAITGTQLLEIYSIVDIAASSYRNPSLDWIGVLVGGFVFGIGATFAGGDAAKIVVQAGKGSKAAWIAVFFFAVFGSVAQFGLLEKIRVYSLLNSSLQLSGDGADAGLAWLTGASKWVVLIVVDILLLAVLVRFWKQHADLRIIIGGAILGASVAAAWYVTGVLSVDEFAAPKAPSAMTVSGPMVRFGSMLVAGDYPAFSFSIAFVVGLFAISVLQTLLSGQLKLSAVNGSSGRIALGGALMGIGGTFAYGCNIGQGYSGLSTLSLESILAVFSMLAGIHWTTRYMEKRS